MNSGPFYFFRRSTSVPSSIFLESVGADFEAADRNVEGTTSDLRVRTGSERRHRLRRQMSQATPSEQK